VSVILIIEDMNKKYRLWLVAGILVVLLTCVWFYFRLVILKQVGKSLLIAPKTGVYLQLEKLSYEHDSKVFEPVKYKLVNRTLTPVYYLSGCAATLPDIYQIKGDQQKKLGRTQICAAIPSMQIVPPGGRADLGWDQQFGGKFVEEGTYQLAVEYSLEKSGNNRMGDGTLEALSEVFAVKNVDWTVTKEEQICGLYGKDFHANDHFYAEEECLKRLNR